MLDISNIHEKVFIEEQKYVLTNMNAGKWKKIMKTMYFFSYVLKEP